MRTVDRPDNHIEKVRMECKHACVQMYLVTEHRCMLFV